MTCRNKIPPAGTCGHRVTANSYESEASLHKPLLIALNQQRFNDHPYIQATQMLTTMAEWIRQIPFTVVVLLALLLGLAPFAPEPHLWEKLKMLYRGTLTRPIDIFDLAFHSLPLVLLLLKFWLHQRANRSA